MSEINVDTTLWRMIGKRQNDCITWEAVPKMVRKVDLRRYWFYGGGGVSKNAIGNMYFKTKKECEDHWRKNHLFKEYIGFEEPTPNGIDELPRTNWEDYEVNRFDCVDSSAVYQGGLDRLVNITDKLAWHKDTEHVMEYGEEIEYLALHEISEQVGSGLITVIVNDPRRSKICQWGNYHDKGWVFLGDIQGYA